MKKATKPKTLRLKVDRCRGHIAKQRNLQPETRVRKVARVARASLNDLSRRRVGRAGVELSCEEVEEGMGAGKVSWCV